LKAKYGDDAKEAGASARDGLVNTLLDMPEVDKLPVNTDKIGEDPHERPCTNCVLEVTRAACLITWEPLLDLFWKQHYFVKWGVHASNGLNSGHAAVADRLKVALMECVTGKCTDGWNEEKLKGLE